MVSLIMLVYKAEPYVEQALRSALEQTLPDMEFVIVNDGTPDNSMDIVRRVLADYPARRVKIIEHPENRGVAVARQTGIDNAEGEYVIFLDSDDWIEPPMCEQMLSRAADADIVVCDYCEEYPWVIQNHPQRVPATGRELAAAILRRGFAPALWNKLIRRSLYSGLRFVPGINLGEDLVMAVKLSWRAGRVAHVPAMFVHYRCNFESATRTTDLQAEADNMVRITAELTRFAESQPDGGVLLKDIVWMKLRLRMTFIRRSRGAQQRTMAQLWSEIPCRLTLLQPGVRLHHRLAHFAACRGARWVGSLMRWELDW